MNRNKSIWVASGLGIVLLAGLMIGGGFFMASCSGKKSESKKAKQAGQQETQLWTCGMHPEVILDKPGTCPKCGMKLVPVKSTGTTEDSGRMEGSTEMKHSTEMKGSPEQGDASKMEGSTEMKGPGETRSSGEMEGSGQMKGRAETERSTRTSENKKERRILYWQAPMNPTEIYDHPGKSKMGMDLVPVYEDESKVGAGNEGTPGGASSAGQAIRIDPVTVQNMGVRSALVRRMDFSRRIRTVGKVDYNEEKLYTISTKISGWISRLYVNYTGKPVRKGEPLFEIYSPELLTTQEEYLLALNNRNAVSRSSFASIREGAESLLESSRQRLLYWDIPASEIARLERTGEARKTLRLNSPADGVVVHKNAVEGAYIKEGTKLFEIADLSTVWVYASIYDYEVPWIAEGQTAQMELSYLPGEIFTGRISYIYPYLDEKAREVRIRLEFPNKDMKLKPGMYANVRLTGKIIENALVIPSEAIIRSGKRNVVFIERAGGKFEPREIRVAETGGPNNSYARVSSGLLEGERVVTSAQFLLDSESRLQEAIQKMLEERKGKAAGNKK